LLRKQDVCKTALVCFYVFKFIDWCRIGIHLASWEVLNIKGLEGFLGCLREKNLLYICNRKLNAYICSEVKQVALYQSWTRDARVG
jgi:hypothetical protein